MKQVLDRLLLTVDAASSFLARATTWLRRYQARIALITLTTVLAGLLLGAGYFLEQDRRAAHEELAEKENRHRRQRWAGLLRELELLRRTPPTVRYIDRIGWSEQAWQAAREAVEIRVDPALRDQAAATLAGLDARLGRRVVEHGASWLVAFSRSEFFNHLVLMGGLEDEQAKVWASRTWIGPWQSGRRGPGPVALLQGGEAVQLVADDGPALVLWSCWQRGLLRTYRFAATPGPVVRIARTGLGLPFLALTTDAARVAASGFTRDGVQVVAGWDGATGQLRFQIGVPARSIALAEKDNRWAAGDEAGRVTLHSFTDGKPIKILHAGRSGIEALAFSPSGQWLAAGDAGGTITLWDLTKSERPITCRGGDPGVTALAFSPDGLTLASGSRGSTKLWDVATGRLLLDLRSQDIIVGLTFSADGWELITSSTGLAGRPEVHVWQLENGRGIRALRGLSGQVSVVGFSPDGRLLAALSRERQLAIWEAGTGNLHQLLELPHDSPDGRAALAFSLNGKRLAFAGGCEARLWEVGSGKAIGTWQLPPGLLDTLVFQTDGRLVLARLERRDGRLPPSQNLDVREDPLVCRLRVLTPPNTFESIAEIAEFNRQVFEIKAAMHGRYVVIEGSREDADGEYRGLKAYDALTGQEVWPGPDSTRGSGAAPRLDPTGKLLAYLVGDAQQATVVELPSGQPVHHLRGDPQSLGPNAAYWLAAGTGRGGYALFRGEERSPLVTLGIDTPISCLPQFNPADTHAAWGNADGSVSICNIERVRQRLAEIGLGW